MPSPEEFIQSLMHAAAPVYDPVKAHEYYLRTRQLKGRQPGAAPPASGRTSNGKAAPAALPHHKGPQPPKSAAQLRKEAEARVAALKVRLDKLHKVLKQLVAQAQAKNGHKPAATGHAPAKAAQPAHLTAKQKADKAKAAKKYYEKHKNDKPPSLSDQEKKLQSDIKHVEEKIKKIKAELKAAVAHARAQAPTSQTATKGR